MSRSKKNNRRSDTKNYEAWVSLNHVKEKTGLSIKAINLILKQKGLLDRQRPNRDAIENRTARYNQILGRYEWRNNDVTRIINDYIKEGVALERKKIQEQKPIAPETDGRDASHTMLDDSICEHEEIPELSLESFGKLDGQQQPSQRKDNMETHWFDKYKVAGSDALYAHSLQSFLYDYCSNEVTDLTLDLSKSAGQSGYLHMTFSNRVDSPIENEACLVLRKSNGQPDGDNYSGSEIDSIFRQLRLNKPDIEKNYNVKIRMSPPPTWAVEVEFLWR